MKNLNRKLSVIALSGMAVFGGVAASAVPAFADGGVVAEQEVKDEVAEELQALIKKVGFGNIYKAVKSSGDRKQLLNEASDIARSRGSRNFNRGSRVINKKNPEKSLEKLLGQRQDAMVLKFKNVYVLIEDIYHK